MKKSKYLLNVEGKKIKSNTLIGLLWKLIFN